MQVKLKIRKKATLLEEGICDIFDAESFGKACTDLWTRLRDDRLAKATSVGALWWIHR
jgi:hypothetical protein